MNSMLFNDKIVLLLWKQSFTFSDWGKRLLYFKLFQKRDERPGLKSHLTYAHKMWQIDSDLQEKSK